MSGAARRSSRRGRARRAQPPRRSTTTSSTGATGSAGNRPAAAVGLSAGSHPPPRSARRRGPARGRLPTSERSPRPRCGPTGQGVPAAPAGISREPSHRATTSSPAVCSPTRSRSAAPTTCPSTPPSPGRHGDAGTRIGIEVKRRIPVTVRRHGAAVCAARRAPRPRVRAGGARRRGRVAQLPVPPARPDPHPAACAA